MPKYTLGEKVTTESRPRVGWRSVYRVYRYGVLFAFLTMENGWGKYWKFYPIREYMGAIGPDISAFKCVPYYGKGKEGALEMLNSGAHGFSAFLDENELRATLEKEANQKESERAKAHRGAQDKFDAVAKHLGALRTLVNRDIPLRPEETQAIHESIVRFEREVKDWADVIKSLSLT